MDEQYIGDMLKTFWCTTEEVFVSRGMLQYVKKLGYLASYLLESQKRAVMEVYI